MLWAKSPLKLIILIALTVRLVAAIFAQGFGMHDDHFIVIEAAQSWVDGTDYNNWLPQNQENPQPQGHSFFYVGLHYLFLLFFKTIGIASPVFKMFLIRLIHALWSLLVVYYGYLITQKLSNTKTANQVGLLLALLWFMPFLSVRNLVEVACIPFLIIGFWLVINAPEHKKQYLQYFVAGLIMAISFSVRFQTLIIVGGVALALLFYKKWWQAIIFGLGALLSIVIIQSVVDIYIWGKPFAEMIEYIRYNIEHRFEYGVDNKLMYIELIIGMLIPPVSLFIFTGMFKNTRKNLILFLPVIIFIAFHTYFPNKQERFVLTVVPMVVMLGVMGFNAISETSNWWQKRQKFIKGSYVFFWIVNIILLLVITTSYSKKARIEAMVYLSKYKVNSIVIEDSNHKNALYLPQYYLGQWGMVYGISQYSINRADSTFFYNKGRTISNISSLQYFNQSPDSIKPQFIIFSGIENLGQRITNVKRYFPSLKYEKTINPSNLDRVLLMVNPINENQALYIFSTGVNGSLTLREN